MSSTDAKLPLVKCQSCGRRVRGTALLYNAFGESVGCYRCVGPIYPPYSDLMVVLTVIAASLFIIASFLGVLSRLIEAGL